MYKDACPRSLLPYSVYYINPALTTCAYRSVRCIGAPVVSCRVVDLKSRLYIVAEGTELNPRILHRSGLHKDTCTDQIVPIKIRPDPVHHMMTGSLYIPDDRFLKGPCSIPSASRDLYRPAPAWEEFQVRRTRMLPCTGPAHPGASTHEKPPQSSLPA